MLHFVREYEATGVNTARMVNHAPGPYITLASEY